MLYEVITNSIQMKIFISHSLEDKDLLQKVEETLNPYEITLLIAEHSYDTIESYNFV